MNTIKHYNVSSSREIYEEKGKKKVLPKHVIDAMMRDEYYSSNFGSKCEKCGSKFGQSFMVHVVLGNFRNGYVCRECQKKYHFVKD